MHHLVNWVELPVRDMERACRFSTRILGAELPRMELGGSQYALFPTEDRFNAGALVQGPDRVPAAGGTLIYLDGGPDLSVILERVTKAGGKQVMEKTWLSREAGFAGLFVDTEGNRIGLQHM
jgi:predicted enzyme related to lactoylglutathione lyase